MLSRRQTNQAALGTVVAVFNVSARVCVRACVCLCYVQILKYPHIDAFKYIELFTQS